MVDQLLGEGAYAEVYRVRHEFLGWQAMKMFKRAGTQEETSAMLDEARLLSTLGHPHIVRLFDAGTFQTGAGCRGYFTMEYVPGGSLQRLLRTHSGTGVPVELALVALEQIASALAMAHRQEPPILHRDLIPPNVLVGYDGDGIRVRLGDFGLAKHADPVSQMASAQGTLAYLAPEVLRGDGYSCAGDVWSWGTLAYLLLTNHFPYDEDARFVPGSLTRFQHAALPPSAYNDDVDAELDRIVLAALALSPRERPADGQELHDALRGRRDRPPTHRSGTPGDLPAPDRRAAELAREALVLARRPGLLPEAADRMEEAVSLDVSIRARYQYRLMLWRRGVTA